MPNNVTNETILIGSGPMAVDYSKVLNFLGINYEVIGRGSGSAINFETSTGKKVFTGGIERYLTENNSIPETAIIAVSVENLSNTAKLLMSKGVKKILLEKPGGVNVEEVQSISDYAHEQHADVYLAYNRRFYSSVLKAEEIIHDDGGISSFNFEFTEWAFKIEKLEKAEIVKQNWFFVNPTHVIDLAFFLGGKPEKLCSFVSGSLPWHSSASKFAGSGLTDKGALFSYKANWCAPGRWGLEVLTEKNKLIFEPLEKLQVQKLGSLEKDFVSIDNEYDSLYKPGLFRQVKAFYEKDYARMINIHNHLENMLIYEKIRTGK